MSRYTVIVKQVEVIGHIWQPCGICAMTYSLRDYDIENIRAYGADELTRDAVEKWLAVNAGDFQSIGDFHADIDEFDSPWASEESETCAPAFRHIWNSSLKSGLM